MHVLIIPSWYPKDRDDVSGSFFREQALALKEAGCRVGVIAPISISLRRPKDWVRRSSSLSFDNDCGIDTVRQASIEVFGMVPRMGVSQWVKRGFRLFEAYVERNGMPGIVHAHCLLNAGALAEEICRRTGIPYVVTEHSSAYSRGLVPNWKLRYANSSASNAAARIAVSQSLVDVLRSRLGLVGDWQVIPNIVDERFTTGSTRRMREDGEAFRFLSVGGLSANKNHELLIRGFAMAFKGDHRYVLGIVGNGPLKARLERLACSEGIRKQITFYGALRREGVRDLLLRSDAFVSTSTSETFGVALIEALAAGVPVIATRSGGADSIVTELEGMLVPAGDVFALSSAMEAFVMTASRYPALELRRRCLALYSGPVVAGKLGEIYQRVVNGRR